MRPLLALALLLAAVPAVARADAVVPSERVRSRVVVRERPVPASRDIGSLRPGERAELLESVPGWHRVRLADDTTGFVSAAWTRRVPQAAPERPRARAPQGTFVVQTKPRQRGFLSSALRSVRSALLTLLTSAPRVDLLIREPAPGRAVYRHYDPNLPVAGFATTDPEGKFDVVLVIDTSTSTNEWARTDVNGDGRLEDDWKGPDSIFQAQIRAAQSFLATLGRLPGNGDGRRIRVGVVTFAGDDRFHLFPVDRDLRPTPEAIFALARRDAQTRVPLTADYAAVERELRSLSRMVPVGMSDFAAGIGRAVMELTGADGAHSTPRPDAQKVIHFLSDGRPRLPYDKIRARRIAQRAARLADRQGIRINAFLLGRDAVTRRPDPSLRRAARWTGGRLVALREPGDVVAILKTTSFSYVERVKLVNETTAQESAYIGTGIDGSFYGEIPLRLGHNQIRVVAVLHDDRETSQTLGIDYEFVSPGGDLAETLARVRRENELLIEQIKDNLAREMEEFRARERARQRKSLELSVERTGEP